MIERCQKCILPANLPSVHLDSSGACNYCASYDAKYAALQEESEKKGQNTLEHIIRRKTIGQKYDCLVPISGGKDSMYVLYLFSKVYRLKVLVPCNSYKFG